MEIWESLFVEGIWDQLFVEGILEPLLVGGYWSPYLLRILSDYEILSLLFVYLCHINLIYLMLKEFFSFYL